MGLPAELGVLPGLVGAMQGVCPVPHPSPGNLPLQQHTPAWRGLELNPVVFSGARFVSLSEAGSQSTVCARCVSDESCSVHDGLAPNVSRGIHRENIPAEIRQEDFRACGSVNSGCTIHGSE